MPRGANLGIKSASNAGRSGIEISGLKEVQEILEQFAPKEARKLNRNTIHAIAVEIRKGAKAKAPRDKGTLRRAIYAVRRRPKNPDKPFSDVRVKEGKDVRDDAFYWHFIEYGTVNHEAQPFVQPAIDDVRPRIVPLYRNLFQNKLEDMIRRKARASAKKSGLLF